MTWSAEGLSATVFPMSGVDSGEEFPPGGSEWERLRDDSTWENIRARVVEDEEVDSAGGGGTEAFPLPLPLGGIA